MDLVHWVGLLCKIPISFSILIFRSVYTLSQILIYIFTVAYRLCGLVIRVSGYRSRGPGFDFRRYHIFFKVVGLERGPLSLVSTIEELGATWMKK
jgi:hypothetical protein